MIYLVAATTTALLAFITWDRAKEAVEAGQNKAADLYALTAFFFTLQSPIFAGIWLFGKLSG